MNQRCTCENEKQFDTESVFKSFRAARQNLEKLEEGKQEIIPFSAGRVRLPQTEREERKKEQHAHKHPHTHFVPSANFSYAP
jgi:hypothetical protein